MELDKKIKVKKIFDVSDVEEVKKYYGKEVYCADFIENFSDLKSYTNRKILKRSYPQECKPYLCGGQMYRFILSAEFVEQEKQYRAYTISEFYAKFHLGNGMILRPKNHKSLEFHVVYNGYAVDTGSNEIQLYLGCGLYTLPELFQSYERLENGRWGSNEIQLYLGCGLYTLPELFQSYERLENGRWVPFGVEE